MQPGCSDAACDNGEKCTILIECVSKVPQVGFQLYSGSTDKGLKGGKAYGWVAKICLRNSCPSKSDVKNIDTYR